MTPLKIYQGYDKTVTVRHDFTDLPDASEVEIYIGQRNNPVITKNLSNGVSGVTSTAFVLTVDSSDTDTVDGGEYDIEARITTASGDYLYGRIEPGKLHILETVAATGG